MRIARNYWIVGAALGGLVAFVPAAMAQGLSGGTQLAQYNQEEHGAAAKEEGEEEGAAAKERGEREGAEAKERGEREGNDARYAEHEHHAHHHNHWHHHHEPPVARDHD
jgi:hypothetical protein